MTSSSSTQRIAFAAATTLALLNHPSPVAAQEGFAEIATDFTGDGPVGVVLPSICIGDFDVPKAMYTLEPLVGATDVQILTNPPNLIETGYDATDRLAYFKFNLEVAEATDTAGIIIRFPHDKLLSIDICCSQSLAVRPGFINLETVTASTGAEITMEQGPAVTSNMKVGSFSGSSINFLSNMAGALDVVARNQASVSIQGNVNTLSCNDKSSCLVSGSILDPAGSKALGGSSVETSSCLGVNVGTESTCVSVPPTLAINPLYLPLELTNTTEKCVNGGELFRLGRPWTNTNNSAPPTEVVPSAAPSVAPSVKVAATPAPVVVMPPVAPPTLPAPNGGPSAAVLHTHPSSLLWRSLTTAVLGAVWALALVQ
mmetsp:Transcript_14628/g.33899  ORF Transcript_14628/g.33899 Transcript_14628/m.33899 type:complete len:371 (+) Transcript_14628:501-1613(+)